MSQTALQQLMAQKSSHSLLSEQQLQQVAGGREVKPLPSPPPETKIVVTVVVDEEGKEYELERIERPLIF